MSPQIFTSNHLIIESGPPKSAVLFINIATIQNGRGFLHPSFTKEENPAFIATEELKPQGGAFSKWGGGLYSGEMHGRKARVLG